MYEDVLSDTCCSAERRRLIMSVNSIFTCMFCKHHLKDVKSSSMASILPLPP